MNLIKGGKQSKKADDSGSTSVAAVDFLGQTRNVRSITPYGLYNSPVLGSNWIVLSSRANSEDLHGIGNDYKNRPKNLIEGEVVLQNLLTGAFIKLDSFGNIDVSTENSGGAITLKTKNSSIKMNQLGIINISSSENVNIDTPKQINLTANDTNVFGNFNVDSGVSGSAGPTSTVNFINGIAVSIT